MTACPDAFWWWRLVSCNWKPPTVPCLVTETLSSMYSWQQGYLVQECQDFHHPSTYFVKHTFRRQDTTGPRTAGSEKINTDLACLKLLQRRERAAIQLNPSHIFSLLSLITATQHSGFLSNSVASSWLLWVYRDCCLNTLYLQVTEVIQISGSNLQHKISQSKTGEQACVFKAFSNQLISIKSISCLQECLVWLNDENNTY